MPGVQRPRRVRKALLIALALSIVLHVAWTFWPVETENVPESTVLEATLTEMPPPPVPSAQPAPSPPLKAQRARPRKPAAPPPVTAAASDASTATVDQPATDAESATANANREQAVAAPPATVSSTPAAPAETTPPPVVLPPRVDLAYNVFLGTNGFKIGDAAYRFEHAGDRYRISTIGQARGLAALIVRGTGKVESQGRITQQGLRPYEFAIERGSADRREVAFFDWDAGTVILHDGAAAPLEPPAFDPLTILWQPYFSPPTRRDYTVSVATTRRVIRYTLTLQGEETITWPRGEILTERWHRKSDDGYTDAWFWLAPSLRYIPIKMRVTRTSRGTLEVVLDSIRVDDAKSFGLPEDLAQSDTGPAIAAEHSPAEPTTADDIVYGMPGSALPPMRAEDLRGQ